MHCLSRSCSTFCFVLNAGNGDIWPWSVAGGVWDNETGGWGFWRVSRLMTGKNFVHQEVKRENLLHVCGWTSEWAREYFGMDEEAQHPTSAQYEDQQDQKDRHHPWWLEIRWVLAVAQGFLKVGITWDGLTLHQAVRPRYAAPIRPRHVFENRFGKTAGALRP